MHPVLQALDDFNNDGKINVAEGSENRTSRLPGSNSQKPHHEQPLTGS
jgi:hypothetical protein